MKAAIFSDLHLELDDDSPRNAAFLGCLKELPKEGVTHLWLLGDIYDLFIGPQSFWERHHAKLLGVLKDLSQSGVQTLWIEGNHDFFIEKHLKGCGVEAVQEHKVIEIEGKKVHLSHGDSVNQEDQAYARWRRTMKSSVFRGSVSLIPSLLGEMALLPLAQKASSSSRKRNYQAKNPAIDEMYLDYAKSLAEEHNLDAVLLGHHHKHCLKKLNERGSFYLNLGSWENGAARFAIWKIEDAQPEIRHLKTP